MVTERVTERVIVVGDVSLAVAEAGRGGRPLLLVHGFTGGKADFVDWLAPLAAEGWHTVAPDQRGHGSSAKPPDESDYSFEIFATDILGLTDALGWDSFVLLGHSMGGMVVQHVALRASERVAALVLMDTSHEPVPVDPELVTQALDLVRTEGIDALADLLTELDGPLETEAYRRTVAEHPEYAELGDRNLRASSQAMYLAMARLITQGEDRLANLTALTMPTLVLVGDQDEPFLEPSRRMAETIGGARLVVLPGGGHSPQFEAPRAWFAALTGFLDELVESGAAPDPESTDGGAEVKGGSGEIATTAGTLP